MTGWDLYGPNLGRRKDDPWGDAIHVVAPGGTATLCGMSLDDVGSACSLCTGYKPGSFDGCWTCLSESNGWRAVRVGPDQVLRCMFCGRFMRVDGRGHEACVREYDRRTIEPSFG